MAFGKGIRVIWCSCAAAAIGLAAVPLWAEDVAVTQQQLQELREQNSRMQEQLQRQQTLIDTLMRKVNDLQEATTKREPISAMSAAPENEPAPKLPSFNLGKVHIGGEGGVGFFNTGPEGAFPNGEFRVDEARLFVEAPIWNNTYFYSELNLAQREERDVEFRLGELYVDFENVSQLWHQDHLLNVRAGRMYIPFGEEYLARYAIDNPLISHSLSDLWGVDEGVEFYGRAGPCDYVLAVQNGGIPDTRDFTSDKSITTRIGYDPLPWLRVSASGMRTGDLDVHQDELSAMWFGNGFFRSVGSAATTRFHANLVEGDLQVRLPHGQLKAFGGYIRYGDNDPNADNRRDIYYYAFEAVHELIPKLYAAARFSQIFASPGYPIAGNGDMGEFFFNPAASTEEIWRLSLGLGYRWCENLVTKVEYSFEHGKGGNSGTRDREDMFALEAAFRF
jgi:hypothetical protein